MLSVILVQLSTIGFIVNAYYFFIYFQYNCLIKTYTADVYHIVHIILIDISSGNANGTITIVPRLNNNNVQNIIWNMVSNVCILILVKIKLVVYIYPYAEKE